MAVSTALKTKVVWKETKTSPVCAIQCQKKSFHQEKLKRHKNTKSGIYIKIPLIRESYISKRAFGQYIGI